MAGACDTVQIARKQRNLDYAERLLRERVGGGDGGGGTGERVLGLHGKMEAALLCVAKKQEPEALRLFWDAMALMAAGGGAGGGAGTATAIKALRKVSLLLQDRQLSGWWLGEDQEKVRETLAAIGAYAQGHGLRAWCAEVGVSEAALRETDESAGAVRAVARAEMLAGFLLSRCSALSAGAGRSAEAAHASAKAYAE